MKILLLGGTGAMGVHLVNCLSQSPENQITVTTRKIKKSCDNVQYITGNAQSIEFITELLKNKWDAIVDFMLYPTSEIFEKHVDMLLNATDHYIFLSSSRVYAESAKPLTEDSPRLLDTVTDRAYLSTNCYSLLKARQENILQAHSKKNWTIIRPYITFSEQRIQLGVLEKEDWLYRALKGRTVVFSEDIANHRTTLTYALDVARGIASILGQPQSMGDAFHITQPRVYTWQEILELYLRTLEKITGVKPKLLMRPATSFFGSIPEPVKYDRLYDRVFSNEKIGRFIDVSTFSDPLQMLEKCILDFVENGSFRNISYLQEAEHDRLTGEHSWREITSRKGKIIYILFRYANPFAILLLKIRKFLKEHIK